MESSTQASDKLLPSFDRAFPPALPPTTAVARRRRRFWSTLLAVPAAYGLGHLVGSRRAGAIAGGLALVGLGVLRWQLSRWFTETPAYEVIGSAGALELRRYPFRIEARTETDASDVEGAHLTGYARLECYLYGANSERETLPCVTPVLTTKREGIYTMALVMPEHRSVASLPLPDDLRVELREVHEKTIAVHRFGGTATPDRLLFEERRFLRALVDAGLVARGSITLATYDGPTIVSRLRKNELWIEVV